MNSKDFIIKCKTVVVNYFNSRKDVTDKNGKINENDVFVVWSCKTLQNNKALLSTTVRDGMYYEITYNGDKQECYLDAYKKWDNITFPCMEAK
jgi:outer membrane protein assembly factor BamB